MIELGTYAGESHRRVGAVAAEICNNIIVTNDNYFNYILEGAKSEKNTTSVQILSAKEAASFIRSHSRAGDTVLFKGKEAAKVLSELK
jgi:UDP-N-acetylmuramoyl-tripeptide--D-alanyl-D-alanine ligase